MKRKALIFSLLIAAFLLSVFFLAGNQFASASAEKHMKLSAEQRIEKAQQEYSKFRKDPEKKTDVLISFNQGLSRKQILESIPENSEIIAEFHYFKTPHDIASGAYTDCSGKSLDQIQNEHFREVYQLVSGRIQSLEKSLSKLEEHTVFLVEESAPSTPVAPQDEDDIKKNLPSEEQIEGIEPGTDPDSDLKEEISSIESVIKDMELQKSSMEKGEFQIHGIRLIGTNKDLEKLTGNEHIKVIEILNFDANELISPVIE